MCISIQSSVSENVVKLLIRQHPIGKYFSLQMEPVDDAVLATERYGSQETWKYRLSDGVMKRERQGEGSFSRGSSITAVFKVSLGLPYNMPPKISRNVSDV